MTLKSLTVLLITLAVIPFLQQCNSSKSLNGTEELTPCQFENPIYPGQDPWVIRHEGAYYYIESGGGGLRVSKSDYLTALKVNLQRVWEQPAEGWNRSNLWAPELLYIQGKWYIYYTAGAAGPPYTSQRSGVLEAVSDDPLGEYIDHGMLYTGDDIESGDDEKWAIDLTVLELEGQLYAIWSGWEENAETDRTPQHLYIAEMENPWTISSNRVKISSPEESWETGGELDLNEGAQILENEQGDVFIVYSTRESWLPAYRLGLLKLSARDADPMDPANWTKTGPVFTGTDQVHGVGHASFTKSPDGTEDWILYHTKVDTEPGWNRVVHMQPFEWSAGGMPVFGTPAPAGQPLTRPSGSCEE